MKPLPCLVALFALALLAQCTGPPPAPGDSAYHRKQTAAYRLGYHHGFMDGSNKLDDNFERYHDEYLPQNRDVFAKGYQTGHEAGYRSTAADTTDQNHAYQSGYDAGQADAENSARPDHRRYQTQFSASSETSFREGYEKGWKDARKE